MPKEIEVTSVLNKTKQRDDWFLDDYTVNLYSSCSFNCLFCYIRGSKYGANLADTLSIKTNALEILDRQLTNRAKKGQYGIIVLSSATDPYLQIESDYELTRSALAIILKHKFPVHIITRSDLIERDFDLLHQIDQAAILPHDLQQLGRGTIISFSFSTCQDEVAKIFEPGATRPSKRLIALENTVKQGFLTGVSLMPLLPYISDTSDQLHLMYATLKAKQVDYILPATITLYGNGVADSRTLMLQAVKKHYPALEDKYIRLFRSNSQLPPHYREAFYKKMKELCAEYGLNNSILEAARMKG